MANKQHIEWLLEGVESWNSRREHEDFVPNLAGVNLYKIFQEAGKLDSNGQIPLSGINLSSCDDPSKADPISADLTDVYPSRTSFTGGKIFRARPWETPSLTGAYARAFSLPRRSRKGGHTTLFSRMRRGQWATG